MGPFKDRRPRNPFPPERIGRAAYFIPLRFFSKRNHVKSDFTGVKMSLSFARAESD